MDLPNVAFQFPVPAWAAPHAAITRSFPWSSLHASASVRDGVGIERAPRRNGTATAAREGAAPGAAGDSILVGRVLRKTYGSGAAAVDAVRGVDVALRSGEVTAITGPSGSGKSTLMHLLAGLDTPTSGTVEFDGWSLADRSERELAAWRATRAGFVLQRNNLIPTLTLEENVAAPLILSGQRRAIALERARAMLTSVGLSGRTRWFPAEVSGGEAARAAIARACVGKPSVIFADEPTGALDSENGRAVLELLLRHVREGGAAALLVTHDPVVADAADRVVRIVDGRIDGSTADAGDV